MLRLIAPPTLEVPELGPQSSSGTSLLGGHGKATTSLWGSV